MLGVIDGHLKSTGKPYLAGDKCTFADLAFVPWHWLLTMPPQIMGEDFVKEWQESFPQTWAWNEKLQERPAVKAAREERMKVIQESKH